MSEVATEDFFEKLARMDEVDTEDLSEGILCLVGQTFVKNWYGVTTEVVLKSVRRNKVLLGFHDRKDCFHLSIPEFLKHYRLKTD